MPWKRVNSGSPCPVCKHGTWCTVTTDGVKAHCMRVESSSPHKDGGFYHVIGDASGGGVRERAWKPAPPPARRSHEQWAHLMSDLASGRGPNANRLGYWASYGTAAQRLGIPLRGLMAIGMLVDSRYDRLLFPMHDAQGNIIGVRTRDADHSKRSIRGSASGLFYEYGEDRAFKDAMVCEGPTDAATLCAMGFEAIGRPSCLGQEEMIAALVRHRNFGRVFIFPDNDASGSMAAAMVTRGVVRLLKALPRDVAGYVVRPPAGIKDVRDWAHAGATRATILKAIQDVVSGPGHHGSIKSSGGLSASDSGVGGPQAGCNGPARRTRSNLAATGSNPQIRATSHPDAPVPTQPHS